jgi:hypothetical protein
LNRTDLFYFYSITNFTGPKTIGIERKSVTAVTVRAWMELVTQPFTSVRNQPMQEIRQGRYQHFQGNEYTVLGVALHSEMMEQHSPASLT